MSGARKKGIVIFGSSRSDGNTFDTAGRIATESSMDLVDLNSLSISPYDYRHENTSDDFLDLAEQMVHADQIVLVSPVYWYSMSAQMKIFMDRWSDLLTIRKDLGRKLKGVRLLLVSCSQDEDLGDGFDLPFIQTAAYMEMKYLGHYHVWKLEGAGWEDESENAFGLIKETINDFK